jgi:hypothetical protein
MRLIARDELRTLAETHHERCVSLYMPTHRAGADVLQNPIQMKNLLEHVAGQLQTLGLRTPEVESYLAPLTELVKDRLFWQYQHDGLAVFLSAENMTVYRLPFAFEALAVVADRFHLKPLLPLLCADGQFYLLTLNQEEIHLFQGTNAGLRELELRDVPESLTEFLSDVDRERQLQFHTSTRVPGGRGGERPANFHGHSVVKSHKQNDILRFFQRIDASLRALWEGETIPLVLAAIDNIAAIYRQANSYPHLLAASVTRHPTMLSLEALHREAWTIVQPHFLSARQEATALYKQLAGSGDARASSDLAAIVAAAYYQRVATLFAAAGIQHWGAFDPQTQAIDIHTARQPGDQDVLDLAVIHTFLNQGAAYVLPAAEIPAPAPAAAILRY